jgi:phage-related protein
VQASKKRAASPEQARHRRGFFGSIGDAFSSAGDTISDVANDAVDAVKDGVDNVGDTLTDVGNTVVDVAKDAVDTVQEGVGKAVDTVQDGVEKAGDQIGEIVDTTTGAVKDFVNSVSTYAEKTRQSANVISFQIDNSTHFNESTSTTLHVIDIDQSFPVFTASLACAGNGTRPAFDTSISITASVKAEMDAEVGFIITGSIVPPQIDDLAFTSSQ